MEKSLTKEEFDEKYEDACKGIEELKEKYYALDKKMEVMDTRIDALRAEMNERFNAMNEKFNGLRAEMNERFNGLRAEMNERFNSSEKRFTMMWTLQVIILLAILGLYLRGIIG